jgi:hypothetical protein
MAQMTLRLVVAAAAMLDVPDGWAQHVWQTGVLINDQIGVSVFGTTKESELCIPSIKTL